MKRCAGAVGHVVPEWLGRSPNRLTCGWLMSLLVAAERAEQLRRAGGGGGRCSSFSHLEKLSALTDARESNTASGRAPRIQGIRFLALHDMTVF